MYDENDYIKGLKHQEKANDIVTLVLLVLIVLILVCLLAGLLALVSTMEVGLWVS